MYSIATILVAKQTQKCSKLQIIALVLEAYLEFFLKHFAKIDNRRKPLPIFPKYYPPNIFEEILNASLNSMRIIHLVRMQNFPKNFPYNLVLTRTCAKSRVRNDSFST